jgi:hypothetical protein
MDFAMACKPKWPLIIAVHGSVWAVPGQADEAKRRQVAEDLRKRRREEEERKRFESAMKKGRPRPSQEWFGIRQRWNINICVRMNESPWRDRLLEYECHVWRLLIVIVIVYKLVVRFH